MKMQRPGPDFELDLAYWSFFIGQMQGRGRKENPSAFRKAHLFQRADVSDRINKLLSNFKETVVP